MTPPAPAPLPLADAAQRLRGKPGRPRTRAVAAQASGRPVDPPLTRAQAPAVAVVWLKRQPSEAADGTKKVGEWQPYHARLLSLAAAAGYVGMSTWVIRRWLADGVLTRVRLPGAEGREADRLLLDVTDLDALIDAGKA